jgi:hypothetical protein
MQNEVRRTGAVADAALAVIDKEPSARERSKNKE